VHSPPPGHKFPRSDLRKRCTRPLGAPSFAFKRHVTYEPARIPPSLFQPPTTPQTRHDNVMCISHPLAIGFRGLTSGNLVHSSPPLAWFPTPSIGFEAPCSVSEAVARFPRPPPAFEAPRSLSKPLSSFRGPLPGFAAPRSHSAPPSCFLGRHVTQVAPSRTQTA